MDQVDADATDATQPPAERQEPHEAPPGTPATTETDGALADVAAEPRAPATDQAVSAALPRESDAIEAIAQYDLAMAPGFAPLGLSEPALRAIVELGYAQPTPIQEQTIPALLSGRDVIAQAPTGTGKTAAFGLPIVQGIDEAELRPQALIITPTRELAIQVAEALYAFGKYREMATVAIYGGQPYERQLRALKRGVQVVVGTPGRLQDLLDRGALQLEAIHTVVLDEADEMLDMGFLDDIEALLSALPKERQTALFSATIPPRIAHLAETYLREPVRVSVAGAGREATAPNVRQGYFEVPASAKPEALMRLLDLEEPESVIVFVRTRRDADDLAELLSARGYVAQAIHGEISQAQRERTLDRFREQRTQILVATDVAARGLDIPEVSHIVNFALPFDAEAYVHRIGRTGRAGRSGQAITLVTPRERRALQAIERAIHKRIERLRLPSEADIAARRRAAFRDELLHILDQGELDPYLALVEDLADSRNPTELAAAAFKLASEVREASRGGGRPRAGAKTAAAPTPATAPLVEAEAEQPSQAEAGAPTRGRGPKATERGRAGRGAGGQAWLLLRVGKRDGVRPTDIVGAIANEAGLPGDEIGDIDIYDTFSFVEVPASDAEYVRAALNATRIRGVPPDATITEPSRRREVAAADRRDMRRPPSATRPYGGAGRFGRDREERPRERTYGRDFGREYGRDFGRDSRREYDRGAPRRGTTRGDRTPPAGRTRTPRPRKP
jgi:ATP-dependent RNA helicase DeaD